jgi:ubiquinone/menaquinone biosynthesis C-methylase UbiE
MEQNPQQATEEWFNATYATKGLAYLRAPSYYDTFLDYLEVAPGQRLLDIGCGPGLLLSRALRRGLSCAGIDLSEVALRMACDWARGALLARCNAEGLCFPRASFDHVTCIGVFEHILDFARALSEIRRVAKPRAEICMLVPNARALSRISGIRKTASGRVEERAATLDEWAQVFRRNGLVIKQIHRDAWAMRRLRRLLRARRSIGRQRAVGARPRHLVPLRYTEQFVFILRP